MNRLLILLFCLFLAGCGGAIRSVSDTFTGLTEYFGGGKDPEPPNELKPLDPEIRIKVVWQKKVGKGYGGHSVNLVPAVSDDKIIIADRFGLVQAREVETGNLLWEVDSELAFSAGPGLGFDNVVMGTSDAEVLALNLENGATLWQTRASSEVLAIPRAENGVVVIRSVDGAMVGLDEKTGQPLWSYERSVPPLSLRGTSSPKIIDERVVSGYASGKLVALRLQDGKLEWETSVAIPQGRSELERLVDLDSDPLILDDTVYVACYQGGVSALTLREGDVLWRREALSSSAGMAADWRYLFLTDDNSDVWELDQRTGRSLWKQDALHRRKLTAPAVYKDYIVVGDFEGYVHFLSQEDGRQLGRIRIGKEAIATAPIPVEDWLFVYGKGGSLAALTIE